MKYTKVAAVAAGTLMALGAAAPAMADAGANGNAVNSPGVLSGNVLEVPVDLGANVCGNTADALGLLNPAFGGTCTNV